MPLKTCHHHGFTVSDMDESVHFYCDLLGLELIQDALRENIPSYDRILGYKDVKLRVVILKDTYESVVSLYDMCFKDPSKGVWAAPETTGVLPGSTHDRSAFRPSSVCVETTSSAIRSPLSAQAQQALF